MAEVSMERADRLGVVSLVQLQPRGLIVDLPDSAPVRSFYDVDRRVEVERLTITTRGIEADLPSGERVLDIHHLDHPDKAYDEDDLVCVGFTAHYDAMRAEFGSHMVDGAAGENILIDCSTEVWLEDLGPALGIENQDTGEIMLLEMVGAAAPCVEFSRFCAQRPDQAMSARRLGAMLEFLGDGRRGFLLIPGGGMGVATVRPGDTVFRLIAPLPA